MKKLLSFLPALCLALPASAALPFEVQVTDSNSDGIIDGADITAAMNVCGTAFAPNNGGCTIVLPRQTISLTSTLVIGGGTTSPASFIFRGQGACSRAVSPPGVTGGTVISWGGANNGTMIEIQRGNHLRFENFCLVLDPDLASGGSAAKYGILFNGDAPSGDITQGTMFENVSFWGPADSAPPLGMTGIYITGTGTPKSTENDKMSFKNCYMRGVDIGINQDALQALMNVWEGGELYAYTNALKVSGGNVDLRDAVIGCDSSNCVVINMAWQASAGAQETLISNVYWETALPTTFLKIADGYSAANTNFGNNSPVIVENSYFTNQRIGSSPNCQNKLLDAATQAAVVFRGNHVNASQDAQLDCGFDINASNPNSQPFATIYWSENHIIGFAAAGFMRVTLAGTKLGFLAPSVDPSTGAVYNDKNLSRTKDGAETAF
jgi:hypothetical protein